MNDKCQHPDGCNNPPEYGIIADGFGFKGPVYYCNQHTDEIKDVGRTFGIHTIIISLKDIPKAAKT